MSGCAVVVGARCLRLLVLAVTLVVSQDAIPAQTQKPAPPTPRAAAAPRQDLSEDVRRFCGVFRLADGDEIEVRADDTGTGLIVMPLGPTGSARFTAGKLPDQRQVEALRLAAERSVNGLLPMLTGRGEVDATAFASPAAAAAVTKLLVGLVPRLGSGLELRSCGSDLVARWTWVQARGAHASLWLKVQWSSAGKISGVVETKDVPPSRWAFTVVRRDWAVVHGPNGSSGSGATLSIEGSNAGRALVLEDKAGLVECVWVRDVR